MKLTNHDLVTVIMFGENDRTAIVRTYNDEMKFTLESLSKAAPLKAVHTYTDDEGGEQYEIPRDWICINPRLAVRQQFKERAAEIAARIDEIQKRLDRLDTEID